jgi:quercetin dioxygenase-like cupin family protein
MKEQRIDFEKLGWVEKAPGAREKVVQVEGAKIRLVEFTDEFDEKDWCTKGHIGIVIEGSMNIEFEGRTVEYGKGDGLVIVAGDGGRHKARIVKGGRVILFLVEDSRRV